MGMHQHPDKQQEVRQKKMVERAVRKRKRDAKQTAGLH